ncbi:MAG: alpha-2-macroglobulin, partial [Saprospiraceae bacterium]
MKNLSTVISLLALFALSLNSCKEKAPLTDLEARNYISAYTQGMINESDPIEFRLLHSGDLDSAVIHQAIAIKPVVGFTISINEDQAGFQILPKGKWTRGAEYEVTLALNKVLNLDESTIIVSKVRIFQQYISVEREGLIIDDNSKPYVRLLVNTSIPEPVENIKGLFDCDKSRLTLELISENQYGVNITFDATKGKEKINWSGSAVGSKEKGTIDVWSYDKEEFTVVNTHFNKDLSEYKVYFTKLLNEDQDAKGLVRLGKEDAELIISNNTLTVIIKTKTNEDMNLHISRGLKAKDGSLLPLALSYEIEMAVVKPELEWIADGVYIPASGTFKVPFRAKALKSVIVSVIGIRSENASRYAAWNNMSYMDQMEMVRFGNLVHKTTYNLDSLTSNNLEGWNEFGLDFTNAFQREKGTIYHVQLSFGPSNTILNCENKNIYDFEKETIDENWFEDRNRYYNYYDYYDYHNEGDPCSVSYYLHRTSIARNVHCTNVFPVIKRVEDGMRIAVKELLENKLANGAEIDLISLQGLNIASAKIGQGGVATFNNVKRKTKAIRISYKGEVSYFNVADGEENPLTEFDVSSNVRDVDNRVFVYTERDVWRPGDTIFLNVMLNRAKFKFAEDLPIVVRFRNPKNVLYKKYLLPIKDGQAIYSFKMPTHLEAPTGYWKADISIGPYRTQKTLRVETIKPNVVDLEYDFAKAEKNWIYNNEISGELSVNYLAGYAMRKGVVNASANIFPVYQPFSEYKNFVFRPTQLPNPTKDRGLWSVNTDGEGKAIFSFSENFQQYASVSRIVIDSKIDLPGGGLNTETESRLVSPFTSYVGIEKARGRGWGGSYKYGETPAMEIIRLDQKGKLLETDAKVKMTLLKYETDWWYDRYRLSRRHSSQSSSSYVEIWQKELSLKKGKGSYSHDTKNNESGMYMLVVEDLESGHKSEYRFHSVVTRSYAVETNPMFINLNLEKDVFDIGETIELKLPAIKDARALVSIERGNEVIDVFWQNLSEGNLLIPVEEDWFPNIYIHVSIVQNYGQQNNDRPLRMYTVQKVLVNQPGKVIEPVVNAPAKVEPNKTFTFEVSEKNGQAIEYTVALVDRGLLNLTGFRTPDPMTHFSKMIALRVKTWDIFSKLMYYMNPSFAGLLSIGGDEAAEKKLDESADFNRFKPVVFHLGSIQLKAGETKTHKIEMPNYIGSMKLMLVACNDRSFASVEKQIRVVSPLMVQSQLPRSLNVTDKVDVPITFFKDEETISEVLLSAKASNSLIQFFNNEITTDLNSSDQSLETMQFTTKMEAGTTDIELKATANGGRFSAFEETKLFVNYPNSYSDQQDTYIIDAGEELVVDISSFGFEKTRNVDLQISGALVPNFTKHYHDLIRYPHGCLEQTTSKALSMLYIDDLMALTPKEAKQNRDYLDAAILKIQSYQKSDGRFSYWRNGYYHAWSDLYAGQYLIGARDKNMLFKEDALKIWIKDKTRKANQWQINGAAEYSVTHREEVLQAYRLFLLAKAGKPAKSAMNRFRKRNLQPKLAKVFLAGAYYYTRMDDIGNTLLESALRQGHSDQYYGYSFGSSVRNKAVVV